MLNPPGLSGEPEVAGLVFSAAILPVGTHLQVWLKVAKLEVVLVIYTKRENVFVELSPLAGYVVAGAQGINARF